MTPKRIALDDKEITEALAPLAGWTVDKERLRKRFEFRDFVEAFGFMTQVALIADKLDHHPNWSNVYNVVEVELWTHDVGGLTVDDFSLASAMDERAG